MINSPFALSAYTLIILIIILHVPRKTRKKRLGELFCLTPIMIANKLQLCYPHVMRKFDEANILHSRKIVATPQRIQILRVIETMECFFSAADIRKKISEDSADLATIYRTLKLFENSDLIRPIAAPDTTQYFARYQQKTGDHAHFFCEQCRTLSCLSPLNAEGYHALYSCLREGDCPKNFTLTINGTCKLCSARARKS